MPSLNLINTFSSIYSVSRETNNNLIKYEKMLIKANKKLNLIGKSTIKQIWHRHFLDSAQVIDFICKNDKTILDLGSGAGFPGLILAILGKDRKESFKVMVIEKSPKKATFLKKIVNELNLNVEVINKNIMSESVKFNNDVFVARAFKPLHEIFELIHSKAKNWRKIIVFQGKTGKKNIIQASKTWDIQYKERESITSSDSLILEISELRKKIN
jgi:16S rRNA (guanine527-N7)-methyltransferase